MNVEEPLDFEFEDPFATPKPNPKAGRKKFIGLDDLLKEHYKEIEESKLIEKRKLKQLKRKNYDSDEDEVNTQNKREAELSKLVDDCRNQVEITSEDDIQPWGLSIFGQQKQYPNVDTVNLQKCTFMQDFSNNKDCLRFQLNIEEGCFFEGLMRDGWLVKLVLARGYLEGPVASWTFHQMLYSSDENITSSACNFWCEILLANEVDIGTAKHLFEFSKLKASLEIYGYLFHIDDKLCRLDLENPGNAGPPLNLVSWLKFVIALCRSRLRSSVLSSIEVEELLFIVISFSLDRRLLGLSFLLDECLRSIAWSFAEEEWHISCGKVAKSLASRVPKDLNCLRIVESISLASSRCKNFRSELALQLLIHCFEKQVKGANEVLKFLASVKLKDKQCDFVQLYIYSVLVENWLCIDPPVDEKPAVLQLWHRYLKNCSTQITSTDWRPYASKVRNRASYLMQSTNSAK